MKIPAKIAAIYLLLSFVVFASSCGGPVDETGAGEMNAPPAARPEVAGEAPAAAPPAPKIPNLQSELIDDRDKTTAAPIGAFDFKNYTYPLPRGWQHPDGREVVLENGVSPMSEEEEKIGLSYVTTKFMDATGDGSDEAFVILKIDTGGAAIPQIVYVFEWRDDAPDLLWYFRTGDRADGGLKDIRTENGETIVELFGQDRYILGELDTSKITGDEEQLCCPTFYTRSRYRWNGNVFRLAGKRLTFSMTDKNAPPIENMGEVVEKLARQNGAKK